jgi:hypothetical protein
MDRLLVHLPGVAPGSEDRRDQYCPHLRGSVGAVFFNAEQDLGLFQLWVSKLFAARVSVVWLHRQGVQVLYALVTGDDTVCLDHLVQCVPPRYCFVFPEVAGACLFCSRLCLESAAEFWRCVHDEFPNVQSYSVVRGLGPDSPNVPEVCVSLVDTEKPAEKGDGDKKATAWDDLLDFGDEDKENVDPEVLVSLTGVTIV